MKKLREIALAASSGVTQYFPQIEGQIILAMLDEIEAARAMRDSLQGPMDLWGQSFKKHDQARAALDELLKGEK